MAKRTTTQRTNASKKAAATKAAATKAANAAKATEGATTQPPPPQGDTNGAPQDNSQVITQAGDQSGGTGDPLISILELATSFSIGPDLDEDQSKAALDLWELLGCEALPPMLAVAIFDCANDQGAAICLRLLGKVGITRDEGQFDLSAVEDRGIDEVVRDFLAWRLRRYAFTAAAATKMLGWSQHILALQALLLTIVMPEEHTQA